jgi:Na+-translocating ferredoxin:NAD+ oxidoreductase RnfG subunit
MEAFLLFILLLLPAGLQAETVYLKPAEALKVIFKDSQEIVLEKKELTEEGRVGLEKKGKIRIEKSSWNFFVAKTGRRVDGYALMDHEIGKTEPITVLTALTPEGKVRAVEILVYREPVGSEVHEAIFLKQFKHKAGTDPIRVGEDIRNISGATLSARAVSRTVKRALVLWGHFYGQQ